MAKHVNPKDAYVTDVLREHRAIMGDTSPDAIGNPLRGGEYLIVPTKDYGKLRIEIKSDGVEITFNSSNHIDGGVLIVQPIVHNAIEVRVVADK